MADGSMMTPQTFVPGPDTARDFRNALGSFATGVTLVTVQSADGPMAFAANSFASLSLDPALVLWSPAKSSRRFAHYAGAQHYAIHILPATARPLLDRFGRDGLAWDGLPLSRNDDGVPVLDGALARFDCRQHATHDGGDHVIIVGQVLRVTCQMGEPLVFCQGRYGAFSPTG